MNKQTQELIFSKQTDNWITDPSFLLKLHNIFSFEIDPCPSKFYKHHLFAATCEDGLTTNWIYNTFINPPYSSYDLWVTKTLNESKKHPYNYYVMLLPVRTDSKIFQNVISKQSQLIVFLKGRQRFYKHNKKEQKIEKALSAPFPSMLVVFAQRKNGIPIEMVKELSKLGTVYGVDLKNKIQAKNLLTFFNLA